MRRLDFLPPHEYDPNKHLSKFHLMKHSLVKRIDEIIIRNKPTNWILTIEIDEKGNEALDYKYPDEAGVLYDHVIFCSAGNGMHKPLGKPAWKKLKKNIERLAEEEARKVNVIPVGTDEIWLSKLKARPENEVFCYRNQETSGAEQHTV